MARLCCIQDVSLVFCFMTLLTSCFFSSLLETIGFSWLFWMEKDITYFRFWSYYCWKHSCRLFCMTLRAWCVMLQEQDCTVPYRNRCDCAARATAAVLPEDKRFVSCRSCNGSSLFCKFGIFFHLPLLHVFTHLSISPLIPCLFGKH